MSEHIVLIVAGRRYDFELHDDGAVTCLRTEAGAAVQSSGEGFVNLGQIQRAIPPEEAPRAVVTRAFGALLRAADHGVPFFACVTVIYRDKVIGLRSLRDAMNRPEFDGEYLALANAGSTSLSVLRNVVPMLCGKFGVE